MTHIKKIGIDARLLYQTGVGVYLRNLLYYLAKQDISNLEFHVFVRSEDLARFQSENQSLLGIANFKFHISNFAWHGVSEQTLFLAQLVAANLDLMHFPYFSWPVLYPKKFIATIHDTTPLHYKTGNLSTKGNALYEVKHAAFRFAFWQQVHRAAQIIVPTQTVARELSDSKTTVVYEGVSHEMMGASSEPIEVSSNFILYVGNFYPHKNVDMLVDTFLSMNREDVELVLAGPSSIFSRSIQKKMESTQHSTHVRFITSPSTLQLAYLYTHARALVNPSLSEGFGLPIVEAMYFGCPLLLSDIPVFREVADGQAAYFDPREEKQLQSLMQRATTDHMSRTQLDEKRFSFEQMAKKHFEIYRKNV